jgi:hypothetical protein
MQLQQPPRPVLLAGNKKAFVWGVGHTDAAHSETWVVKAHANKRGQTSVYVGTRRQMGQVNLSIHAGCWLFCNVSPGPSMPGGPFALPGSARCGWGARSAYR